MNPQILMRPPRELKVSRALYYFHSENKSIEESLNIIGNLIYKDALNPDVVGFSKSVVGNETNPERKIYLVHEKLKKVFRYKPDPLDRDFFKSAPLQINEFKSRGYIEGDCDDAVILSGSILKSLGFPIRLIALSNEKKINAPVDHIALLVHMPNMREIYFDLTIDFMPKFDGRHIIKSDII